MTNKLFAPIAFTGVAIFAATLTLITSRMQALAADSAPPAPAHFWTELADPAHAPKAQTMPDFVDLAAKLSPAVVNISTDEPDEPSESTEPQMPEGSLDLDRLAVLADALSATGCADADILAHLRSPGPHVRGCWALDLLLGKE